jgi:hypothetical protein
METCLTQNINKLENIHTPKHFWPTRSNFKFVNNFKNNTKKEKV